MTSKGSVKTFLYKIIPPISTKINIWKIKGKSVGDNSVKI
jgi:hypothetical protein